MNTGVIYKIELNENNIYIGSTTQLLCKRQSSHNYDLKKKPNRKLYKSCIENNITVIKCVWVADVEYSSNEELRKIEEDYRKKLNGNLNSIKCYISEEYKKERHLEYYENNKDKIKEYYKNNKEKRNEYCEKNKDKIKEYRENNKDKMKEYRENNKKKIKEYYEKNKDKLKEKIKCDKCGCMSSKNNIKQHQRSNKCKLLYECIFSDSDSD